jgi:hypothetical protein
LNGPGSSRAWPRRAADTDWPRIAALYDRLRVVAPSPVVDLNRAIAHSMAFGPEAGLRLVDEIADAAACVVTLRSRQAFKPPPNGAACRDVRSPRVCITDELI